MTIEQGRRYSMMERWQDYQPTKTGVFWMVVGAVVATTIVGFSVGGWTTASTANEMAEQAAQQARAELAAVVCVERVLADERAEAVLTDLKGIGSSFRRRQVVETGEWAKLTSDARTDRQAAALCAEALYEKAQQRPVQGDSMIEATY